MVFKLNELPSLLESKKVTEKEAVNELAEFLLTNSPIFGLNKFDEDFRNDIILTLLEKGSSLFTTYKKESGVFFNYVYCYVLNLIVAKRRKSARNKLGESVAVHESITTYEDKIELYTHISHKDFAVKKVPFAVKQITPEDLRDALENNSQKLKRFISNNSEKDSVLIQNLKKMPPKSIIKTLEILALRSSSSITDDFVERICEICDIDTKNFMTRLLYCRQQIAQRHFRKDEEINKRNRAFFLKNKYELQISLQEKNGADPSKIAELKKKLAYHTKRWNNINKKLEEGYLSLTPSIKDISVALQMSERQVFYYLTNARKLFSSI